MITVKEAVHQLLQEFEVLSDCTLYIANDLDSAIDQLIAAAEVVGMAKGTEQERLLIKSKIVNLGGHLDHDVGPIAYVPCWVLDNTPEPTGPVKEGKPSQALIDELTELASVLAPTKE